jgi:hypothetical protein
MIYRSIPGYPLLRSPKTNLSHATPELYMPQIFRSFRQEGLDTRSPCRDSVANPRFPFLANSDFDITRNNTGETEAVDFFTKHHTLLGQTWSSQSSVHGLIPRPLYVNEWEFLESYVSMMQGDKERMRNFKLTMRHAGITSQSEIVSNG